MKEKKLKKLTACKNCKNFNGAKRNDMWYNHICYGVPGKIFDYYMGKLTNGTKNYCRDINTNGNCPYFEKKIGFFERIFKE